MLGIKNGADGINTLRELAAAGIILNCQIVCCPGVNDGAELQKTMEGLCMLGAGVNSVSVVPVGLTAHRRGLAELRPFDSELALSTVRMVESFGEKCRKDCGSSMFFCADELYLKAGVGLPPDSFYEDYPQLENGVGMMRLLITEFEEAIARDGLGIGGREQGAGSRAQGAGSREREVGNGGRGVRGCEPFSVVTGVAAFEYLTNLLKTAMEKYDNITGKVYAVENRFFGESVTVSGLVTGGDIISRLKGCDLGSRILIPQNMLRRGDDVFLDDVTVSELSESLGVAVRVVRQDGADLLNAFLGI
jgi:NifB/MoaA-like Fe-S oxidoreductase